MSNERAAARKRQRQKEKNNSSRQLVTVMGSMAIVIVILVGAVLLLRGSASGPEQTPERLALDPILGNPNAPVTVIEYAAYGCEACRAWHEAGVMDQILERYPDQVRFIYRDIPIIMPTWSQQMAEVAQCALDQGNETFWAVHDVLFVQTQQGRTTQTQALQLAANYVPDVGDLRTCVDENTHYQTVRYDMNRDEARGIRSTPTWFVNGQQVFNASPAVLQQMIDTELARLGG